MGKRKLKIAFIGIRGIPIVYSGFETLVEKIASELKNDQTEVTVYCRKQYVSHRKKKYKGVKLVNIPIIKSKHLETWLHSYCATQHIIINNRQDLVFIIGVGSAIFSLFFKLFGIKSIVHVDGLDWKREKWGVFASCYLHFSEFVAALIPNKTLTDSEYVKSYYHKKYKKNIELIGYGADITSQRNPKILKKYGLKKGYYFMVSGRFVPDNHLEEAIYAYTKLNTKYPLVVVGDSSNDEKYKRKLYKLSLGNKIIFTGFISKPEYYSLLEQSYLYVETKRSGGTHPSLVEASKLCRRIVCVNNPAHRKVLSNGAMYYPKGNIQQLTKAMSTLMRQNLDEQKKMIKTRKNIINTKYNWDDIALAYKALVKSVI